MTQPDSSRTAFEIVERDALQDMFAAAPGGVVRELKLHFRRVGGMGLVGCGAIPITEFNRATAVGVDRADNAADLAEASGWLRAHANAWAFQAGPSTGDGAALRWLRDHGLAPSGNGWAKHTLQPLPESGSGSAGLDVGEFDVREVDAGSAEMFATTAQSGFGLSPAVIPWFATLAGRPGWRIYLAFADGRPAATATMFLRDGMAWFGIDATLPPFRGRGAQRALIARRIADARSSGIAGCTAETGHPGEGDAAPYSSMRNYRRAGFALAYVRPNYKPA